MLLFVMLSRCDKKAKKIYMLNFNDSLIITGQTLLITLGCIPFVLVLGLTFCISEDTCSITDKSIWTSCILAGAFISACSFVFMFTFFVIPRLLKILLTGTFIFEVNSVRYGMLSIHYDDFNEISISDEDIMGQRCINITFLNNGKEVGTAPVGGRLATVSQRLKQLVKELRLHGKKISITRHKKVKCKLWKIMNGEY